jgi:hypothetical protein
VLNLQAPLQQQQQHASHPPKHLSWLGTYLRNQLAHDKTAQKALLGMTLLMTAMVLGDGVLTPSISGEAVQRLPSQATTQNGTGPGSRDVG